MVTPSTIFRILALLAAMLMLFATYFFSPLWPRGDWPFGPAFSVAFASLSLLSIWFAIRGQVHGDRMLLLWAVISGLVVGFLGMLAGVLGSIYFWPQSNLAPILGFFVTGPYSFAGGVLLGILAGLFVAHKKIKHQRVHESAA